MTRLAKTSWVLYNTTNISAPLISLIYWGFIYNPGQPRACRKAATITTTMRAAYNRIMLTARSVRARVAIDKCQRLSRMM